MKKVRQQAPGLRVGPLATVLAAVVAAAVLSCTPETKDVLVGPRAEMTGTVARVVVTPAADTIVVGATAQLTATAYASDGSVVQTTFTWSSSNTAVAKVSSTGLVTGAGAGAATVAATSGGVTGTASVTVRSGATTTAGNVVVNTGTRFQVMSGWEATAQAMQGTAAYPLFRDSLLTLAANDLGITRLRVPVRSGAENSVDYWTQNKNGQITPTTWQCKQYAVVNDDSDPNHINPAGFHFSELDSTMQELVLPFRAKMAALGKRLFINLNYTEFNKSCGSVAAVHQTPSEYAEFALAAFQHLQQKFGVVPDYWELDLEPENGTLFTGKATLMGQALGATAAKLSAAGFHPQFIAPSTEIASNAPTYFDGIESVSTAHGLVSEISYHRYVNTPTTTDLSNIAQRARTFGIRSAMLERIGAAYNELIQDLTVAQVSAWQEYALAFTGNDDGGKYYIVNTSTATPTLSMGWRTKYLRQFFRYVLPGATRIAVSTSLTGVTPVAFQNASGKAVAVVLTTAAVSFTLSGLPSGTYGLTYTADGATGASAGPDQTIAAGQLVTAAIPKAGIITIFQR